MLSRRFSIQVLLQVTFSMLSIKSNTTLKQTCMWVHKFITQYER